MPTSETQQNERFAFQKSSTHIQSVKKDIVYICGSQSRRNRPILGRFWRDWERKNKEGDRGQKVAKG